MEMLVIIILAVVTLLLSAILLIILNPSKNNLNINEKKLAIFCIDMYLKHAVKLNIIPNENESKLLINELNKLHKKLSKE